jgi:oxepin-CoA hydrolase/3-oxo-5,6-dehydrosuberyl-CoA semialdehyde dehydrogenase
MIALKSYACGEWKAGEGEGRVLRHAITGEDIATVSSKGIDFKAMINHARTHGGPALRETNFNERAAFLKTMAGALNDHLDELYDIAATYGATKGDAMMDVDGGIAVLGYYASLGTRKLPAANFLIDGEASKLSKPGNFVGRHVYVPLEGVVVQVNAHNFPSWGMLEKLAPSILAGMPNIVKPATPSAWLAQRMVEILVERRVLPEGALQLICGSTGDLFDHLTCQDVVAFTGSASTGRKIRSHSNIVAQAIRVNIEADSLNCIVLGPDVEPGTPTFKSFVKEVVREMTVKAGQKCTAIRRVLVPKQKEQVVIDALIERLAGIKVGDPSTEGVRMGPLVDTDALASAREGIETLKQEADVVYGDPNRSDFEGVEAGQGSFMEPVLLCCKNPEEARLVHEIEVFGPAATVVSYEDVDQAIRLARRGEGSLVGSLYSEDDDFSAKVAFGVAPYHGRFMVMNAKAAEESMGHGVVMPQLVHGGPGRAGGGEELGGIRSVHHFMQRLALQGDPERLEKICS